MPRRPVPAVSWADVVVFGLLFLIALGFSALAADNPLGMTILVIVLLTGTATVLLLLRTREGR